MWETVRLEPGQSTDKVMRERVASDRHEVLRSQVVRGVWYAAVRHRGGEVHAMVALIDRDRSEFACKVMNERARPVVCEAPQAVLDVLTATCNGNALEWRQRCRERLAMPKPKRGWVLKFADPIPMNDGTVQQQVTFMIRNQFTGIGGQTYIIPGWRSLDYTIVEET